MCVGWDGVRAEVPLGRGDEAACCLVPGRSWRLLAAHKPLKHSNPSNTLRYHHAQSNPPPQEVRRLLMSKYGKLYDLSFAKRSIPGKTFVSLNVMWLHLGQRSFQLTPEQYADKLDSIAQLINVLNQTDKVGCFGGCGLAGVVGVAGWGWGLRIGMGGVEVLGLLHP